ncbi:cobalamin biosynthesis protein [Haloactinospora alba]|uniref:cobalamin biosynthesis protein n=1 Tax=Haloactinospora alba TaxID=405555 RepID=UPI00114F693D|nr:cobalamin biosynthesis protein [Haloactinospora alba]
MITPHRRQRVRGIARGLLIGTVLDRFVPEPRRGHPVALYGTVAAALERRMYRDSRRRGAAFAALAAAPVAAAGAAAQRAAPARAQAALTGAVTWSVVGGAALEREAELIAADLEAGDLASARQRLPHLCGRDPESLDEKGIARAVVESVAENTSDAVVAPLVWGALLGIPGLAGYRAVNTLDAMVGHRSPRYERFGWACARLDDVANWLPARATAVLAALSAPVVSGSPLRAWRSFLRDGRHHPSPNAGWCEAAFAGALDKRLGGRNMYGSRVDERPELGEGGPPDAGDIRRAVRLARTVNTAAAVLAAAAAVRLSPGQRSGSAEAGAV